MKKKSNLIKEINEVIAETTLRKRLNEEYESRAHNQESAIREKKFELTQIEELN